MTAVTVSLMLLIAGPLVVFAGYLYERHGKRTRAQIAAALTALAACLGASYLLVQSAGMSLGPTIFISGFFGIVLLAGHFLLLVPLAFVYRQRMRRSAIFIGDENLEGFPEALVDQREILEGIGFRPVGIVRSIVQRGRTGSLTLVLWNGDRTIRALVYYKTRMGTPLLDKVQFDTILFPRGHLTTSAQTMEIYPMVEQLHQVIRGADYPSLLEWHRAALTFIGGYGLFLRVVDLDGHIHKVAAETERFIHWVGKLDYSTRMLEEKRARAFPGFIGPLEENLFMRRRLEAIASSTTNPI